jgi:hypothetical protein
LFYKKHFPYSKTKYHHKEVAIMFDCLELYKKGIHMGNTRLFDVYKSFDKDKLNQVLVDLCKDGSLAEVKFLLTSPEIPNRPNIHYEHDEALISSFTYRNTNITQYLLSSSELTEHADIHAREDRLFKYCCSQNQIHFAKYLIFKLNIEKTIHIKNYLKIHPNKEIEEMFKIRDLNIALEKTLSYGNIVEKKIKI